jgi:glyoxylase-like metal-dependent hydrolase (beta-lactamase superfamily II)
MMASERLYLVEGNDKAVLIDAGTGITDLDKIAASLTTTPVRRRRLSRPTSARSGN